MQFQRPPVAKEAKHCSSTPLFLGIYLGKYNGDFWFLWFLFVCLFVCLFLWFVCGCFFFVVFLFVFSNILLHRNCKTKEAPLTKQITADWQNHMVFALFLYKIGPPVVLEKSSDMSMSASIPCQIPNSRTRDEWEWDSATHAPTSILSP